MVKLVETQMEVKPVLERLTEATHKMAEGGLDEASRTHLRNIDVYTARLLEESAQGRSELVDGIRSELKVLARTVAGAGSKKK